MSSCNNNIIMEVPLSKIVTNIDILLLTILLQSQCALYGIDWNGPLPDAEELEQVEVTNTINPLQERDFEQLQRTISPIGLSDCQGVDLYIRTLEFVFQKLT